MPPLTTSAARRAPGAATAPQAEDVEAAGSTLNLLVPQEAREGAFSTRLWRGGRPVRAGGGGSARSTPRPQPGKDLRGTLLASAAIVPGRNRR